MNETWWYLSRSSGIVATVLIVAALIWGFYFSARDTGDRHKPNWWLDLHNYLGGLALIFTMIHLLTVYLDDLSGIGLVQVLVPHTAPGWRWGMTWGVIATYLLTLVVFTSWPKRLGSRRTWVTIHLLSIPATIFAGVHAWMVGSSRHDVWFQVALAAMLGLSVYPGVVRLFSVAEHRRDHRARSAQASQADRCEPIAAGERP